MDFKSSNRGAENLFPGSELPKLRLGSLPNFNPAVFESTRIQPTGGISIQPTNGTKC